MARGRDYGRTKTAIGVLVDAGMSWRDIAEAVGVSVMDAKRMHRGEGAPDRRCRDALWELAALVEWLAIHVPDPAAWLETPLVAGHPMRPLDAWRMGSARLPALALGATSPEEVLDAVAPRWREHPARAYELYDAEDGQRSIRLKRGTDG